MGQGFIGVKTAQAHTGTQVYTHGRHSACTHMHTRAQLSSERQPVAHASWVSVPGRQDIRPSGALWDMEK